MSSRVAGPRTLGLPLYIAIQTHQPQLKLKPQLQHKLLRSLRSLRPRCLRSPNNHNSNHNCNTNSSVRCAHSGHAAYGLHAQKEQIDLLATLGELFAPSSLSAVFGSFGLPALGSYLSKSRKTKAAKIFCRLRSPHN